MFSRKQIDELISGDPYRGPAYYEDGVITYKARPGDHFDDAMRKLKRSIGINVDLVKRRKHADIVCRWSEGSIRGRYAGLHEPEYHHFKWKPSRAFSNVTVRQDRGYSQSTVIHELGHALGLDHPRDHDREDTIMSYGAPSDLPWFTKLDRAVLRHLYA